MKSIRLSLILFIMILQGFALVAVLGLLYRTTSQTLAEKDEIHLRSLRSENAARCEALSESLNDEIYTRATEISALAQSRWGQTEAEMYAWWAGQSAACPVGGLFHSLTWISLNPEGNVAPHFTSRAFVRIQSAAESVIRREKESQNSDYFQVYDERGEFVKRSSTLSQEDFVLPVHVRVRLQSFRPEHDDAVLKNGTRVRRVTVKMPVTSVQRAATRLMLDGRDAIRVPFAGKLSPAANGDRTFAVPSFFLQYARDVSLLEESLVSFQKEFEWAVARHRAQSAETLNSLRLLVAGVGLALFGITAAGAYWLTNIGLAPLKRLSEAVSRVSPKDFRLPHDPKPKPQELRPIYNRLTQTLGQLERAFAREKQSTADISHELRTPLTALLTTIEVGLRRPRTPEQYAELLQECHGIGGQLTQLVERLLALARIDACADTVRAQEIDVTSLAAQCVALVKPLAEARDISLRLHADGPVRLTTDENKLREVITNLLHNAVEYNKPRGRIDLSVERNNGHLQLHVRDTGIGISPKALGQIFERFYRVDESRHADSLHAGLGLSIVKSYLEILGGSIKVESTEGEGSTFSVELPVVNGPISNRGRWS